MEMMPELDVPDVVGESTSMSEAGGEREERPAFCREVRVSWEVLVHPRAPAVET